MRKSTFWQKKNGTPSYQHIISKNNCNIYHNYIQYTPEEKVALLNFGIYLQYGNDATPTECTDNLKKIFNPLTPGRHLNVLVGDKDSVKNKTKYRYVRFQHLFLSNDFPSTELVEELAVKITELQSVLENIAN